MRVNLEILKPGDAVLNVWDSSVAVRKPSGEVEIFQYYLDNNGLPRLATVTFFITFGNGSVSAKSDEHDENSFEITTF